jgi:SulP family sulfate permease
MVAVAELIKIKPIIKAWKTERHDWIVAIITFLLTLFLAPNIELWIAVWVSLSLALFISRSMRPNLIEVSMYKDWLYRDVELFGLKTSKHVSVFRFDWVLYFANAGYFEDRILELISEKKKLKYVIFDLEWMADIDSSGIEIFENLINRLNDTWVKVLLTWLRVKVIRKLEDYWFLKRFWKKHIFVHVEKALDYIYDKKWDDIDLDPLEDYEPNKNWKEELWRYLIKKYVKK